jgi:ribonuclease HI
VPQGENSRADYYSKRAYCDYLKARPELRERYCRRLAAERQPAALRQLGADADVRLTRV